MPFERECKAIPERRRMYRVGVVREEGAQGMQEGNETHWATHCATNRKVAGSIFFGIFWDFSFA
jgi:hypothetical protein